MAKTKKGGKKKKKAFHLPWTQLLTPASLASYDGLMDVGPNDEFDPNGAWAQTWQIYLLRRSARENVHQGHIRIERKAEGDGVRLIVDQANIQAPQKAVCNTKASVLCRKDEILTPASWTLETALCLGDGSDVKGTRLQKAMAVDGGKLRLKCNGRISSRPLPAGKVTSNWGILSILSCIADGGQQFTMLDELDKVKSGHRLCRSGETTIPFDGKDVKVCCYHQIGSGCLPWEFYVDTSTKRVLLALSGLRAYILDAKAMQKTKTAIAGFSKQGGKKR